MATPRVVACKLADWKRCKVDVLAQVWGLERQCLEFDMLRLETENGKVLLECNISNVLTPFVDGEPEPCLVHSCLKRVMASPG